jgi:glycosyltransferase involved in cell wall biosynthesis
MTKVGSLSIVIPAYNEERRLPQTLERVFQFLEQRLSEKGGAPAEVLVVDDGSSDKTADIAREAGRLERNAKWRVRVIENPGNRGKGYAVRNGVMAAANDWILITDADLSTPMEDAARLFRAVEEGAEVAFGSRAVDRSLVEVPQGLLREISGRVFNLAMRLVVRLPYSDTQCGFKLYSRTAARRIFSRQLLDGFGFDVEDLYLARKLGYAAKEVAVRWRNVEGSKVSLLTGLKAFYELWCVRRNSLLGRYKLSE